MIICGFNIVAEERNKGANKLFPPFFYTSGPQDLKKTFDSYIDEKPLWS